MQTITLSGGSVAYRQQGHGPALLLLHGWAGSSIYWRRTLEHLADSRTVYALDLPGYGSSPPWSGSPGVQSAAALVAEFADALGLSSFDLNGHSLSSSVAACLAVKVPHRIRRLVLTCASTYRNERERRLASLLHHLLGLWVTLRRPWMARTRFFYRAIGGRFFYRAPADDGLLRAFFEDFLRMDRRTGLAHAFDALHFDYHAVLRQIAVPTLVIGARQDTVMPPVGTPYLARLIPNCQLNWIDQCGHLPMLEQPGIYHRLLREFLLES